MRYFCAALALTLAACAPSKEVRQAPLSQAFVPGRTVVPVPAAARGRRPDPTLMPGDLLRITVYRQPDLDLEVRIPERGSICFPLIGDVEAAGGTSSSLEREIRLRLEQDYLKNPSVAVTVREYAQRKVFIVGGVSKPDRYEVAPESRLTILQLVAAAGGFTDRAYQEYVQVVRRRGEERLVLRLSLVDVEREIAQGRPEADLELWPDDLVVVPSAVRVAHVLGAVHKPGSVDVPHNARMTVSMAVAQAGSYTRFASTGRVQILRHDPSGNVSKIAVDLDAILVGRVDLDLNLEPGDVVWVPERTLF